MDSLDVYASKNCMSSALNRSSVVQYFKCSDPIKIHNRITFENTTGGSKGRITERIRIWCATQVYLFFYVHYCVVVVNILQSWFMMLYVDHSQRGRSELRRGGAS